MPDTLGSAADPPLAKDKPNSDADSTFEKTYLRKDRKQRGKKNKGTREQQKELSTER